MNVVVVTCWECDLDQQIPVIEVRVEVDPWTDATTVVWQCPACHHLYALPILPIVGGHLSRAGAVLTLT